MGAFGIDKEANVHRAVNKNSGQFADGQAVSCIRRTCQKVCFPTLQLIDFTSICTYTIHTFLRISIMTNNISRNSNYSSYRTMIIIIMIIIIIIIIIILFIPLFIFI